MKLDEWDLGYNPIRQLDYGASVVDVVLPGGQTATFAQSGAKRSFPLRLWVTAPAMGGAAAGSQAANEYLAHMIEEWFNNPLLNDPVLVSLSSLRSLPQDGFYVAEHARPDYTFTAAQRIPIDVTMTYKAPGPPTPQRLGMWRGGGTMRTNFVGGAGGLGLGPTNLVGFPIGATQYDTGSTRTGAEGAIPVAFAPQRNPAPFAPHATLANLFKGACRVFDTLSTASNPIPAPPGAYHANWIEVKGSGHAFVGDCVMTNGLLLLLFQNGTTPICTIYLWSTGLATPGWQQVATLQDTGGTLRSFSLLRVSRSECALVADEDKARVTIRLPRAGYGFRVEYDASFGTCGLKLVYPATPKILYNGQFVADQSLSETVAASTMFGVGIAVIANSAYPFLGGFLYKDALTVGTQQPSSSGTATIGLGETDTAIGERSYGVVFVPFGVNGGYNPTYLQAEAESGTLGTGWTSQAGAGGNSNALEAKCASGTAATNADTFGTTYVPRPGRYLLAFRVKVTSAAGSTPEMTVGLWNNDNSNFIASRTLAANEVSTGYAWVYVPGNASPGNVLPTATKNVRFRAVTAATLGTDWFIDQAVLLPTWQAGGPGLGDNPIDVWDQYLADIETRLAVM